MKGGRFCSVFGEGRRVALGGQRGDARQLARRRDLYRKRPSVFRRLTGSSC